MDRERNYPPAAEVFSVDPMVPATSWSFCAPNEQTASDSEEYRLWSNLEITKQTKLGRMTVAFPVNKTVFESASRNLHVRAHIPCCSWVDALAMRLAIMTSCKEGAKQYEIAPPRPVHSVRLLEKRPLLSPTLYNRMVRIQGPGMISKRYRQASRKPMRIDIRRLPGWRGSWSKNEDQALAPPEGKPVSLSPPISLDSK